MSAPPVCRPRPILYPQRRRAKRPDTRLLREMPDSAGIAAKPAFESTNNLTLNARECKQLFPLDSALLRFTGNIPRGVFCEWSVAEVTENPRVAARNGVFAVSVHRVARDWARSEQQPRFEGPRRPRAVYRRLRARKNGEPPVFPWLSASLYALFSHGWAISLTSSRRMPPFTLSSASSLVEMMFPTVVWNFLAMFHSVSSGCTM